MSLRALMKDYVEMCLGRIRWMPNVRLFLDQAGRKKRLIRWDKKPWADLQDEDDRTYSYYRGRSAQCLNEKWRGVFPRLEYQGQDRYLVPMNDCRDCEFHESPRCGRNFPCCRWDRDRMKRPTVAELADKALQDAERLISQ
jgi:hypothetical protein